AEETVQRIRGFGRRSAAEQADVADDHAVKLAIQSLAERIGPIDGLVVSAGVFEGAAIQEMTAEFWDRTMAINVRGTFS
ncbi:SDR family NAD(P)-dependent oxidoreductase, partial [Shewanella algae]|uniref:SDR family NAD(P)-dependent oxidoreductase n=1 Tax=Shewanella algae TaxID=38313 RepID=UPI00313E3473